MPQAEESLNQRIERIRASLEQLQQEEKWPRAEVYDREGDHHFSVRIEPTSTPASIRKKDSS
jgi:hypothetical protein